MTCVGWGDQNHGDLFTEYIQPLSSSIPTVLYYSICSDNKYSILPWNNLPATLFCLICKCYIIWNSCALFTLDTLSDQASGVAALIFKNQV